VKNKSTSPTAIRVKNQGHPISTEEKLDILSRLEKGERTVDKCRNIILAHSSLHIIRDCADRMKESAICLYNIKCQQSETGSDCVTRLPQSYWNELYQKLNM
jgi:hypothetical protein